MANKLPAQTGDLIQDMEDFEKKYGDRVGGEKNQEGESMNRRDAISTQYTDSGLPVKLLPCPFCGGDELSVGDCWDMPGGYVRCDCGCMLQLSPRLRETSREKELAAVNQWNQRYSGKASK